MRFPRWMLWVALTGCGGAGHDGAQAGQGGGSATDAGHDSTDTMSGGSGGNSTHGSAAGHSGSGAAANGGGSGSGSHSEPLQVPRIYPIVRAGTPTGLIADAAYRLPGDPSLDIFGDDGGMPAGGDSNNLAQIVQDRLYSGGPTELLRIVHGIDDRTAGLDTDPSKHPCLAAAPVARTWMFPGAQTFTAQLQCMSEWPGGWLTFGFADAEHDEDAGVAGGKDFYLVQGQDGGMGGAYRIRGGSGDVEAWITVADSRAPSGSQVLMHLWIDASASTTELAFGGSAVGFCSAHLKTGDNHLFVRGKPNAPPPPGAPNGHYCGSESTGCFSTTDLHMNLGAAADGCKPIDSTSFAIHTTLDSSSDPEGNVMPSTIYQYFNSKPQGISAF